LNQIVLLVALYWLNSQSNLIDSAADDTASLIEAIERAEGSNQSLAEGFERFLDIISNPHLWKSLAVIAPSALIKAEIENILPLFADHSLGFDTMAIGLSFSSVAIAFVISSISIGLAWDFLTHKSRDLLVGSSLVFLSVFSTLILPVTRWTNDSLTFTAFLAVYGIFLGLTITPSSFLLGEFVDSLKDSQSKDVANGLWNTIWELGGSLGFFVSGIPRSNDWRSEEMIISSSSVTLLVAAVGFYFVAQTIRKDRAACLVKLDAASTSWHSHISHEVIRL
jgi:MFS family permease